MQRKCAHGKQGNSFCPLIQLSMQQAQRLLFRLQPRQNQVCIRTDSDLQQLCAPWLRQGSSESGSYQNHLA
eukprot:741783-Pelagomonas_calceolata.AAC.1